MKKILKDFGFMYKTPFFVEYNDEYELPYRVEVCNSGHYFRSSAEAFCYAADEIKGYFKLYPRRDELR